MEIGVAFRRWPRKGGKHFRQVLKEIDAQGIEPAFKRKKVGATFYARVKL